MTIQKNISLKQFNSFHVEAFAKYFCELNHLDDINLLVATNQFLSEEKLILGGGSNILFTKDYNGIVIKNNFGGIEILSESEDNVLIEVGAGHDWDKFVEFTINTGLNGLENLSFIPGTVGASPIQNIGAYGVEVKDVIESVKGFSLDSLEQKSFSNSECKFGYRNSIFKNELKNSFIVTSVIFKLYKDGKTNRNYESIKNYLSDKNISNVTPSDVRNAVIEIRKSKLPDPKEIGNAGSFFKNPIISNREFEIIKSEFSDLNGYKVGNESIKISAGWLIEKCGLKGKRLGNVGVYEKQALVVVNYGNAVGSEIFEFSQMIQAEVKVKFDIELIYEVNVL